jgi:hypothetical protein
LINRILAPSDLSDESKETVGFSVDFTGRFKEELHAGNLINQLKIIV